MKLFITAELILNVARGLFTLALGMLLFQATDSLWAFALTFVSEFFVAILLQGIAGTLVDRFGAKNVLLSALGLSTLSLLIANFFGEYNQYITLIVLAILLNIGRPFIRNSVFVLSPMIAGKERLEKLNGYISISLQLGQMLGMALAGVMLEFLPNYYVILATFFGYMAATIAYYFLFVGLDSNSCKSGLSTKQINSKWRDVIDFLCSSRRTQVVLLCASIDYMAIALFNLILAPAIEHLFNGQERWLSYIDISFAVGALTGGVLISKNTFVKSTKLTLSAFSGFSVCFLFVIYLIQLNEILLLIIASSFGLFVTMSTVAWLSEIQRSTPSYIRGKVGSLRYIANSMSVTFGTTMVSLANDKSFNTALVVALTIMAFGSFLVVVFGRSANVNTLNSTLDATKIVKTI